MLSVCVFQNAFVRNCLVFDFQYADMIHKSHTSKNTRPITAKCFAK